MLKTVFIGAVEGSKIALQGLIDAGFPPGLVLTLPPAAANRHSDYMDIASPARDAGCEVFFTTNINDEATLKKLKGYDPDICMVMGWSQICHSDFRSIAKLGNVGFHPAALPKLRGRAVIPWTILIDAHETGSTMFWLDDGVDSGDIILQRTFKLDAEESARTLYDKHTKNMGEMAPLVIKQLTDGSAQRIVQDHSQATYCAKRTPQDGQINWNESADVILRFIRAVGDPYPGAFTLTQKGTSVVVDQARLAKDSHQFIGIVGQVQSHTKDGFTVMCGDRQCVEVLQWRWPHDRRPKVHSKFQN